MAEINYYMKSIVCYEVMRSNRVYGLELIMPDLLGREILEIFWILGDIHGWKLCKMTISSLSLSLSNSLSLPPSYYLHSRSNNGMKNSNYTWGWWNSSWDWSRLEFGSIWNQKGGTFGIGFKRCELILRIEIENVFVKVEGWEIQPRECNYHSLNCSIYKRISYSFVTDFLYVRKGWLWE